MTDLAPITHPLLTAAGVKHGFFTRAGGVSTGIYEGLNAGVGSKTTPPPSPRTVAGSQNQWAQTPTT